MREHSLRRQIVSEMHLRRWPLLDPPMLVIQVLLTVSEEDRPREIEMLASPPEGARLDSTDNPRHQSGELPPDIRFTWERHSEASALTLFFKQPNGHGLGEEKSDPRLALAKEWIARFPGEVIRATRIRLVRDDMEAGRLLERLDLSEPEIVSCHIGRGPRIWSDFRIGQDGFGNMVVAANGVLRRDLTRTVQRLQELGNYRNLALLGLPVARTYWPELDRIEESLSQLASDVSVAEISDDRLLDRVSTLSLDLISISTGAGYRMSATSAYAQLVEERLAELEVQAIEGFPSLEDFTQRRLLPAVRTCATHVRRESELSQRAATFAALLRTRIETRIENQNARLLKSMERSASMQLRLQRLVEGLSVVALSYYALGLASYLLKGLAEIGYIGDANLVVAMLTPAVMILMWWITHLMKRKLLDSES